MQQRKRRTEVRGGKSGEYDVLETAGRVFFMEDRRNSCSGATSWSSELGPDRGVFSVKVIGDSNRSFLRGVVEANT